jgi:hypothetical protein
MLDFHAHARRELDATALRCRLEANVLEAKRTFKNDPPELQMEIDYLRHKASKLDAERERLEFRD